MTTTFQNEYHIKATNYSDPTSMIHGEQPVISSWEASIEPSTTWHQNGLSNVKIPNADTILALSEADDVGRLERVDTIEELFSELDKD